MANNIYAKLAAIQSELFVPKGKKNEFGGFNYRSCEDILKEVKPLVAKNKCALFITNRIVQDGDRTYVEAVVRLADTESDGVVEVTAQAREPAVKKGMDEMQVTGATSSYARKYALAGLFCIDNEKDADTMDNREEGRQPPSPPPVRRQVAKPSPSQRRSLGADAWAACQEKYSGMSADEVKAIFEMSIRSALDINEDVKVSSKDITDDQWRKVIDFLAKAA